MRRRGEPLDDDYLPPKKRARRQAGASQPSTFVPQSATTARLEQDLRLPLELWVHIFERLDSKADLQSITRVCSQFHELVNAHYYLWYKLHWQKKGYDFFHKSIDVALPRIKTITLNNGDVAILHPDGSFSVLPATKDDWRHFNGHLNPDNFQIALPVKNIVSLHFNQLATCADDGIRIWNRLTAEQVQHLPPQHPQDKPFTLICTKHNDLVSASPDGSIYLYPSDQSPARRFEYDKELERGELIKLFFWRGEYVAEFDNVIVTWNQHGNMPVTKIIKSELQAQLMGQMRRLLANQEFMASAQLSDNDVVVFDNPANQGLEFDWHFAFWEGAVEVTLNKAFSFVIDIYGTKSPLFLGVGCRRAAAHDASGNYFVVHQFMPNKYKACSTRPSQESVLKYPLELIVAEPVKTFFVQPSGKAFFLLYDNRGVCWDIPANTSAYIDLAIPEVPPDMTDLYRYGDDDWTISMLLGEGLIGLHKLGQVIIWDMCAGRIKQHFMTPYMCPVDQRQHMLRLPNDDILVERWDEGRLGEDGVWGNRQYHTCIYRFLPPPPTPVASDDAAKPDSDILGATPGR